MASPARNTYAACRPDRLERRIGIAWRACPSLNIIFYDRLQVRHPCLFSYHCLLRAHSPFHGLAGALLFVAGLLLVERLDGVTDCQDVAFLSVASAAQLAESAGGVAAVLGPVAVG
jgi:hypothetical protein